MSKHYAKFAVGQLVHHRRFDYRGAVYDVDPVFQGSDEWYDKMAKSKPPKNEPWYHVIIHQGRHTTYVAERNLEADRSEAPIDHVLIDTVFEEFKDGVYIKNGRFN